jgi:hypothetical protein
MKRARRSRMGFGNCQRLEHAAAAHGAVRFVNTSIEEVGV